MLDNGYLLTVGVSIHCIPLTTSLSLSIAWYAMEPSNNDGIKTTCPEEADPDRDLYEQDLPLALAAKLPYLAMSDPNGSITDGDVADDRVETSTKAPRSETFEHSPVEAPMRIASWHAIDAE